MPRESGNNLIVVNVMEDRVDEALRVISDHKQRGLVDAVLADKAYMPITDLCKREQIEFLSDPPQVNARETNPLRLAMLRRQDSSLVIQARYKSGPPVRNVIYVCAPENNPDLDMLRQNGIYATIAQ